MRPVGACVLAPVLTTSLANVLIKQIFKHSAIALKACRIDVGQVIGNNVHARLLRIQTSFCNPHASVHGELLLNIQLFVKK
jgi:hypothetical protein